MVRIAVADTGPGIPEALQPQLFEPFNRLGLESGEIEGTGIGLTICQQIVHHLDARLGFESREGHGSTFWVEVPHVEAPPGGASRQLKWFPMSSSRRLGIQKFSVQGLSSTSQVQALRC
ncbi:MAG: ATP-binding protein [Rhodospirillaceae bacterium]|nr:ATP-binding protein [Rhodospirillaceae bacterium]